MQKKKFMIYHRDAKKGDPAYSPKSHSAPYYEGRYVKGMEEWASWYCFNKRDDGMYEAELDEAWNEGSHNGGGTITVDIPQEWFSLSYDSFLEHVITLAGASHFGFTVEDLKNKKGLKEFFGFKDPIELVRLSDEHIKAFKEEMQEAFQHGFEAYNKDDEETNQWQVLPDEDFYRSLEAKGAEAYEAIDKDGQRVGGAILSIHKTVGELAFLYVKVGVQSKGIGQAIWRAIEAIHPEIEIWETCTPYFDRRNIHFYINRCGFHAVEFFNERHPDPNMLDQFDQEDGMFKFEKKRI